MDRIKVMHVLTDTNVGGAGTLLYNTLRCGDTGRFDYVVVLPNGSRLVERFSSLACRVLTVEAGRDRSMCWRDIPRFIKVIREERPDILHAHSALSARIAARMCRVPVCIQTRHCVFPLKPWQKNALFRAGVRLGSRMLSDQVVAVAEAAKQNLLELGVDGRQIQVIINGVLPVRRCEEAEVAQLRHRLGLSEEHFVVGMPARLEEYKGQGTVIRAAARCVAHYPEFRFLLIGDGGCLLPYQALARELGVEKEVIFVGFVEDMAPYYALMQVNVNASFGTETSSLALSEGMSVGVPAVASVYGGNPKMVVEGENGLLFPIKDETALSERLMRLHEDRGLLARLSEGALRHYRERLTATQMVGQLESLYLHLWQGARGSKGRGYKKSLGGSKSY